MKNNKTNTTTNQAGFTIVELMIATMVFSSIILVITFGVLQFSKAYYKGITASNTQNAARNIIDATTQAAQYSGGTLTTNTSGAVKTICIGNSQFDYQLDTKRTSTSHVLYVSPNSSSSCATKAFDATASRELIDPNMRLAKFDVSLVPGSTSLYTVTVRVVYGETDLLTPDGMSCQITTGSQFCATSELSATIQKRIN